MNSKVKPLPLLAGAITLSISIASVIPAFAQSTPPTAPPQRGQMHRSNFLNLTPEQQARMEQIRKDERSQIDAILTADQKAQLQSEWANRKPFMGEKYRTPPTGENSGTPSTGENRRMRPSPFASLNLTAEQRSKIEAVMRSSKEQMDAVLTEEQRQQLQQHQQQHQQRHQQWRQGNPQGNPQNLPTQ